MKVAELEGRMLDYWVAKACGYDVRIENAEQCVLARDAVFAQPLGKDERLFEPSEDWMEGGLIIDQEEAAFQRERDEDGNPVYFARVGRYGQPRAEGSGPTHLIAAMRAYVASQYGEEVPAER